VITSGKAIRESLEVLKSCGNPEICGIVISVDRQERGRTQLNALKEVENVLGIPIYSIVTITDIKTFLHNRKISGRIFIDDEMLGKIDSYLDRYGSQQD
jgi:orotate phosphoribosyltransferase